MKRKPRRSDVRRALLRIPPPRPWDNRNCAPKRLTLMPIGTFLRTALHLRDPTHPVLGRSRQPRRTVNSAQRRLVLSVWSGAASRSKMVAPVGASRPPSSFDCWSQPPFDQCSNRWASKSWLGGNDKSDRGSAAVRTTSNLPAHILVVPLLDLAVRSRCAPPHSLGSLAGTVHRGLLAIQPVVRALRAKERGSLDTTPVSGLTWCFRIKLNAQLR